MHAHMNAATTQAYLEQGAKPVFVEEADLGLRNATSIARRILHGLPDMSDGRPELQWMVAYLLIQSLDQPAPSSIETRARRILAWAVRDATDRHLAAVASANALKRAPAIKDSPEMRHVEIRLNGLLDAAIREVSEAVDAIC
jgi:hypothetical protein